MKYTHIPFASGQVFITLGYWRICDGDGTILDIGGTASSEHQGLVKAEWQA